MNEEEKRIFDADLKMNLMNAVGKLIPQNQNYLNNNCFLHNPDCPICRINFADDVEDQGDIGKCVEFESF